MIRYVETPPSAPNAPRSMQACRRSLVERMADVICETAGSDRPVTIEVFEEHHIPARLVERHAEEARAIARRRYFKRG